MIAYGYQAKGDLTDDVAAYIVDRSGNVAHEVWFKSPYVGIMHDIAITENHISEAYAIGTADDSLSGPILKFIEAPPK